MLAGSFSLGHIPYADSIANIDHSHGILFTASPLTIPVLFSACSGRWTDDLLY
jgi:hypothetical protein